VSTIAGGGGSADDGVPPLSAALNNPTGLAVDPSGTTIYVADTGNNKIRKISSGQISTVVGGGTLKADGLPATLIALNLNNGAPSANMKKFNGLTIGPKGELYFSEPGNFVVRKLQADGTLVTIAGVYGVSGGGGDGGPALDAFLNYPSGVAVNSKGDVFITDTGNHAVRVVSNGIIYPFAGQNGTNSNDAFTTAALGYSARLRFPVGLALDSSGANLFMVDSGANDIMKEVVATLLNIRIGGNNANSNGEFAFDFAGDNVTGVNGQLSWPHGITVDPNGVVFITDTANNLIRTLTPNASN
jgi:DNA-binding beta-propeller fold protein YncE